SWRAYRRALGAEGAPDGTFRAFDESRLKLTLGHQLAPAALLLAGLLTGALLPVFLAVASLMVVASGWAFKYTLITRAAFNQGYAINRMPARGAGDPAAGIKPGWTVA
ncbi:MAG: hypothetical protein ACE5FS_01380, partial [Paracoccaceae bacterium]